jgi:hypothetical protein
MQLVCLCSWVNNLRITKCPLKRTVVNRAQFVKGLDAYSFVHDLRGILSVTGVGD